jgi:hypothetical protein
MITAIVTDQRVIRTGQGDTLSRVSLSGRRTR